MMFSVAPTLRALIAGSPITTAIREANRMARRHLETGGMVTPVEGRKESPGFVVPADVDPAALAEAIKAKLRADGNARSDRSEGLLNLLEQRPDGKVVVPQVVLVRLGTGDAVRGEQLLDRLIGEMRRPRVCGELGAAALNSVSSFSDFSGPRSRSCILKSSLDGCGPANPAKIAKVDVLRRSRRRIEG